MASLYTDWKLSATYGFTTVNTPKLPSSYTLVKLVGMVSYSAAVRIDGNELYTKWRVIYPTLPEGTPDTPVNCEWLVFESQSGETIVLADVWINGPSVVPVDFTQATVTVTDTNNAQMMALRDFMSKSGMKFQITFA